MWFSLCISEQLYCRMENLFPKINHIIMKIPGYCVFFLIKAIPGSLIIIKRVYKSCKIVIGKWVTYREMSGISTNVFTPKEVCELPPHKNTKYKLFLLFYFWTYLSLSIFQTCYYFFFRKTQKTTSEHNAAKRDFPRFYLLLNFFYTFWKRI